MPSESPTKTRSTPLSSRVRAKLASYAVSMTSLRPSRLASASIGTVQALRSGRSAYMRIQRGARPVGPLAYDFDTPGSQRGQRVARASNGGNRGLGVHFETRYEHERALVQVRMRDAQAGHIDDFVAIKQDVQLQASRSPTFE